MPDKYLALEIKNSATWQMLCSLIPHLNELSETENIGNFFLIDFDTDSRWMICSPATITEHFDHIETTDFKVVTVHR